MHTLVCYAYSFLDLHKVHKYNSSILDATIPNGRTFYRCIWLASFRTTCDHDQAQINLTPKPTEKRVFSHRPKVLGTTGKGTVVIVTNNTHWGACWPSFVASGLLPHTTAPRREVPAPACPWLCSSRREQILWHAVTCRWQATSWPTHQWWYCA
jgi:hypothetical protein